MKDKLVKTGHRKGYYRFIGALRGMAFSLLALMALAAPVFIAATVAAAPAHADEVVEVVETSSEESSSALLF